MPCCKRTTLRGNKARVWNFRNRCGWAASIHTSTPSIFFSCGGKPRNWERWETVSNALFTVETIFLWLGGIHPNKSKKRRQKENVLKYQELISDILYEKFVEEPEFHKMKSEQKEKLRQQLDVVDESREKLRKQLKSVDNLTWEDFKANKQQLKLLFKNNFRK